MNFQTRTFQFFSDTTCVKEASQQVLDYLNDLHLKESTLHDLKLCFEEAFINAVKYGNKSNPDLTVDVEVKKNQDVVELVVRDHGSGFENTKIKNCTKEENLTKTSGRGVFLIKKLMDEVSYENNGTTVRMKKFLKNGG